MKNRFLALMVFLFGVSCEHHHLEEKAAPLDFFTDSDGDGVTDKLESILGFDHRRVDITSNESKFFNRAFYDSEGLDLQYSHYSNVHSRKHGVVYKLGEIVSNTKLYLFVSPGIFYGEKVEYREKSIGDFKLFSYIPYNFEGPLEFEQDFSGVLGNISLVIGKDEYTLKELYDSGILEDSWYIRSQLTAKKELQIVIKDLPEMSLADNKDIYLKLYPTSFKSKQGIYLDRFINPFGTNDWGRPFLPVLQEAIRLAGKYHIGLSYIFGVVNDDRYYRWLSLNVKNAVSDLIDPRFREDFIFHQGYSISVHSIILNVVSD